MLIKEDLKTLVDAGNGLRLSLFMPTYRKGQEAAGNPIRFKNLLRQAEGQLSAVGARPEQAGQLLTAVREFAADGEWWEQQSDGLALFASAELLRHYELPYAFPELVVVGRQFHLKPLLPLLTSDGHFHVLALSQNQVRLLKGTRMSITEMTLENVPQSLQDLLQYSEPQAQLNYHAGPPGGPRGGPRAIFHGHGGATEDRKDDIREFFRKINQGMREVLREHEAPLVLAGVDYVTALYREVNSYPHLVKQAITGNPEELSAQALHRQAWEVVAPIFAQAQHEAAHQYREAVGLGLAAKELEEVVPAAYQGRVGTLFVPLGERRWGRYDPASVELDVHEEPQPGDQDLLDAAAVQTLLQGGKVFAVNPSELPDYPVAAVMRY